MIILGLSKDLMSAVAVFFSIVNTEIEPCCFVRAFSLNIILKCRYSSPFFKCLCLSFYRCCYLLCVAWFYKQVSAFIGWYQRDTRVCQCNENNWPQQIIDIKHVIFTFEYFSTKDVLNNLSDMCTHKSLVKTGLHLIEL